MGELWETGGCSSLSKDGHQPIPPPAHPRPPGKTHIQSVDSRLQPEALPLAEGKVIRWGGSVSLEMGSPAAVQKGYINWGRERVLEFHLLGVCVCVCIRETVHKSGTWHGPNRAWDWSPGYKKERQNFRASWFPERGVLGRILAGEALGALAFLLTPPTLSWIYHITPIHPPRTFAACTKHTSWGTGNLQPLWFHSLEPH